MNPSNTTPSDEPYDRISRVRAPDPHTVIVELKRPYAAIVSGFFGGDSDPILPAHLLARYTNLNRVAYNSAPIGSGPYRFTHWAHGDRIDLTANDRYYGGKPAIRNISLRIVENSATVVNELLTGEVDTKLDADVSTIGALRAIPGHRVIVTPTAHFCAAVFNLADPILRDVVLRRAFAMAIDRRMIVDKVADGLYDPDTGMRGLFTWAFNPDIGTLPYDPRRARTLLAQDGWVVDSDGIRAKRGRRLEIQLAFYNSLRGAELIPLIAEQERAIGIDVTTRRYGPGLFALDGPLYQGRFQVAVLNLQSATDPDPGAFLSCKQRAPNGVNWARYCNAVVDRAIDRGASVFDRSARRRAYSVVQRQVIADVPMDFLWQISEIDVIPSRLQGFDPVLGYASVARWRWQNATP